MKTVNIKLTLTEDIKDFVRVTSRYDYDVDLRSGRYVIDAKSILGIFSLDLTKPIAMDIHDDNCKDLLEAIKPFEV